MRLAEAFNSPEARFTGTFVFVDMCDSTALKEQGEATWIPTIAWMYDTVAAAVERGGKGTIVKYLGDGLMIVYGPEDATTAINDAVHLQEALEDGVEGRLVRFACSIGIAAGIAVRFESPHNEIDYIAPVTDRAARLCDVASPQAVFVDTATLDNAQMNKISSRVGEALRRTPSEYKGEIQKATLKGFPAPVEYHEIKWSQQLFGIKSKVVTASIDSATATTKAAGVATPPAVAPIRGDRGDRGVRGIVKTWNDEHRRGFIQTSDGERLYTDMRFVVTDDELEADDVVYCVPRDALTEGKARVAGAVMAIDQVATGTIVSVCNGFAFIRVVDSRGDAQDIYTAFTDCDTEPERHQRVEFALSESVRGARAEEVRLAKKTAASKAA